MPISVALPAPQISWEQELYCPAFTVVNSLPQTASGVLDGLALRALQSRSQVQQVAAGGINSIGGYGTVGTTGVINRIEQRHGRPCIRLSVAGTTQGDAICPPDWSPAFNTPASSLNPGSLQDPASIVAVWDWHMSAALAGATPQWPNDTSPVIFTPDGTGQDIRNNPPGGTGPGLRGFGVFLNNVGGVARYEYVSWNDARVVLERVTIGASIVPLISDWSTFRFIIVGAGSAGRSASLSLQVNGFDVVVGRTFGSVVLENPLGAAAASNLCGGFAVSTSGGTDLMFYQISAKLGRFTPSGSELQGD